MPERANRNKKMRVSVKCTLLHTLRGRGEGVREPERKWKRKTERELERKKKT